MGKEIVPYERHDGWTKERQDAFIAALEDTGNVTSACTRIGLSTTSAYKARFRIQGLDTRWKDALDQVRPKLEEVAYQRAVEGVDEPIMHQGKIVGYKKRFSDGLLKMMIQRGTRNDKRETKPECSDEELMEALMKNLDALEMRGKQEQRCEMDAWAEEMARKGWAP